MPRPDRLTLCLQHGALLKRSILWVHQLAPKWLWALAGITILAGLIPLASVYLTREIVDAVTGLDPGDAATTSRLVVALGLLAAFLILSELLEGATTLIRSHYDEIVADAIQSQIHEVTVRTEFKHFENADYFNQMDLATSGAAEEVTGAIDNLLTILQHALTLGTLLVVIARLNPWLMLILVGAAVPTLWVSLRQSRRHHALRKALTPDHRRASYYDWLLQSSEPAGEIRVFDLGAHFRARFRSLRAKVRGEQLRLDQRHLFHRMGTQFFGLALVAAAMAFVVLQALRGQITPGDVAMFYRTLRYGQGVGVDFARALGAVFKNTIFLQDFYAFLDRPPEATPTNNPVPIPEPLRHSIEFRNVTFAYPGEQTPAIEHLNLRIPASKITAIIGPNGSGKTTLMKLLTRLYHDYQGTIQIGGTELSRFSPAEFRKQVATLFQSPMDYHLSLRENITLGASRSVTEADVQAAAQAAGLDPLLKTLPDGLDTLLGKWLHDGRELSGGEWQRVALARALIDRSPIVMLDEPTSNMDPWAEAAWMRRVREHLAGRTLIIITHRLSIARQADHVAMVRDGRVIAEGPPAVLQGQDGDFSQAAS